MELNTENLQFIATILGILTVLAAVAKSYFSIDAKGRSRDEKIKLLNEKEKETLQRIEEKITPLLKVDAEIIRRVNALEEKIGGMGELKGQIALLTQKLDYFSRWFDKLESRLEDFFKNNKNN